jgi:hypothetical protein
MKRTVCIETNRGILVIGIAPSTGVCEKWACIGDWGVVSEPRWHISFLQQDLLVILKTGMTTLRKFNSVIYPARRKGMKGRRKHRKKNLKDSEIVGTRGYNGERRMILRRTLSEYLSGVAIGPLDPERSFIDIHIIRRVTE